MERKPPSQTRRRGVFGSVIVRNGRDAQALLFPPNEELEYADFNAKLSLQRELKMMRLLRGMSNVGSRLVTVEKEKGEVFMVQSEAREAFQVVGTFLLDIAKLKHTIIIPSAGEELHSFVGQALAAYITREPIPLFTPFCPDWSRNAQGRYDFKTLGGDISFIGQKFFKEAQPLLAALIAHDIPFEGHLIFANWGLETEIDAKDTYGKKLSPNDIASCFASTHAKTDERLLELQQHEETAALFAPYRIIPMTDFFMEQGVDPEAIYQQAASLFDSDRRGNKLFEEFDKVSYGVNHERLGLTPEENRKQAKQNLAEYATLGMSFGRRGCIIAAESATATKSYNIFREQKLPVFFLKGKKGLHEGVNIL